MCVAVSRGTRSCRDVVTRTSLGPTRRCDEELADCPRNDGPRGGRPVSRWMVNVIPAWVLLIVLIVLIAGGAGLIQTYVRRRFPVLTRGEHNDLIKFTEGFVGFVYAFFIGFVVSAMWGQINAADGNARAEGAAAGQMARDLNVFEQVGDRLRQSLLAYERAAVAEWSGPGAGDA